VVGMSTIVSGLMTIHNKYHVLQSVTDSFDEAVLQLDRYLPGLSRLGGVAYMYSGYAQGTVSSFWL
jgi:hypothetical protein